MDHAPGFLRVVDEARAHVRETTVDAVRARQARGEAFTLLDVREDSEWSRGHIPGAVHIGRGVLERDAETVLPDPSAPIVLYCGGGFRSVLAAESLGRMGYTDVESMDGGYREWTDVGAPVDRPEPHR